MVHDIFISYAAEDKSVADTLCSHLENMGIRCWIAPRNIEPGEKYATAIIHAIEDAEIVVVVFSHHSDQSAHVRTEIERAFNRGKVIIPFRIENIEPSDEIQYFVGSRQWLDAFAGSLDGYTNQLAEIIKKHLSMDPVIHGASEKIPYPDTRHFTSTPDKDFPPKKNSHGKLHKIIYRFLAYSIDYGIGLVFGLIFFLAGFVIAGTEATAAYGIWLSSNLWILGVFFWIAIIDIFRVRSPGKALLGLQIYWPSDRMKSFRWKAIRSMIKGGPLLTGLLATFLGYPNTTAGDLINVISLLLWIALIIPIIFTSRSQSVHDLVVGTVVYSG